MQDKKKKNDSPYETIQILKKDRARLMDLAMQISVAKGEGYKSPPPPAQMIEYAINALEILSKPTTKITSSDEEVLH